MRHMRNAAPFLFLALLVSAASATDLSKIDRTIAKEPAYKGKPTYCLLVFGPEAKTRIWLVLDGDVLYVDRNGNGDLTEGGESLVAARKTWAAGVHGRVWTVGDVAAPGGKVIYKGLTVSDVSGVVVQAGQTYELEARVGTPGLDKDTAAIIDDTDLGLSVDPDNGTVAELEFADRTGRKQRQRLKLVCD